jgi:hypothetical protein
VLPERCDRASIDSGFPHAHWLTQARTARSACHRNINTRRSVAADPDRQLTAAQIETGTARRCTQRECECSGASDAKENVAAHSPITL